VSSIIPFILGIVVASMAWGGFIITLREGLPLPHGRPGWVTVPIKPTRQMLEAAAKAMSPSKRPTMKWVSARKKHEIRYRAMIDAANK
jgi:hypothetical protein